jgi:hypothetical protein
MEIMSKLFGRKVKNENTTKPFYANATREERQDWFGCTRPWDRIASTVVDAILDGITDKTLLEVFVMTSMKNGLVARYEPLGLEESDPTVIRAQVSQILCQTGNRAIVSLTQALEAKQMDAATKAYGLAHDTFETSIALAKNQIVAYAGRSTAFGLIGKRAECHEYASRGLVELAEMRRLDPPFHMSAVFPADALDQMERQLRGLLEC